MSEFIHQLALIIGYIFMVAGGLCLLTFVVANIADYCFRQMKAVEAFFHFVRWREAQKKVKP